jgi:hypothetical protein
MALPDIDDLATYGGQHIDAHQQEDPLTDCMAAEFDAMSCTVAMGTHTAIRAWVLFTGIAFVSNPTPVIPDAHDAVWGSATAVRPTIAETAAGIYVIGWATTQTDQLLNVHATNIRFPFAPMVFGADGLRAKVVAFTANTITVNTFSGGSANALAGTKVGVLFI